MEVGEIGKNGKTVIRVVVEARDTGTEIVTTRDLITVDKIAPGLLSLQGLLAIRSLAMVILKITVNYF